MVLLKIVSKGMGGRAHRIDLRGSGRRKIELLVFGTLLKITC